jgi:hypothetical protein
LLSVTALILLLTIRKYREFRESDSRKNGQLSTWRITVPRNIMVRSGLLLPGSLEFGRSTIFFIKKGLVAVATLFIYLIFLSLIHLQSHLYNTFIHLHSPGPLSIFFIALLLRWKNLPGVPSRDLNSGLPYIRPAHYPTELRCNLCPTMLYNVQPLLHAV